ncbi:MAG TPA: ribonuclease P protein component [Methylotenera sp.]|nr:ribonuclease P protein component [Methylotenera sp.]HPH04699.1 ribonuclease P protein component [Methylotenera sp.]HPN01115.1 ribonuclease P protein component [Methylotenera sp.]
MAQTYKLPKQAKLTKADDFSSVFNFRKRIASTHLVMHYQPNIHQRPRIGLVVSKKVAKLAVSRNYIRRVLRELFRLKQHDIAHVDLVLRVQKKFTKCDFIEITKEFDMLVSKLNQKAKATFSSSGVVHSLQGEI